MNKNKGILLISIMMLILIVISLLDQNITKKIAKATLYNKAAFEIQDYVWYSHTTTNDIAYNGNHITVNGNTILFNGYGQPSYKDFLFNMHNIEGTKIFRFRINEVSTDWHTLEGGGFLFNSKIDSGKLTGYCLLYEKSSLSIYRLDNIDVNTFHDSTSKTISANYGTKIISVAKPASTIHNLEIVASPTNIKVTDNNSVVINQALDYSKHVGNQYGPIVSYMEHNCSSLSKIQFEELDVIEEFPVKVYKYDQDGKPIKGATFDIKNEAGNLINTVTSDENGLILQDLSAGKYTYTEKDVPSNYILDSTIHNITVDKDGNATGDTKIYNKIKNVKFEAIDANDSSKIKGNEITIYKVVNGNKQEVYKGTTNENGILEWNVNNSLETGTYTYKETSVANGYIIDNTEYTVEINKFNPDGSFYGKITSNSNTNVEYSNINSIQLKNTPITVTITKVNEIDEKLKDAKFKVYKEDNSFNSTYTTDSNGQIILTKLEPGEYLFNEIEAPNGYTLDQTVYKFQVDSNGNVTGTTKVVNKELLPQGSLPNTGLETISIILISILVINGIIAFRKAKIS